MGGRATFTLASYPENFIKYIGTGGARFSMVLQARATGGIWFRYGGLSGVIDPGPGSLTHIRAAAPELNPHNIRVLLLTHKHLDHSTDINVLAEAMTGGGFEKHGAVILPHDCVHGEDRVLLNYMAKRVGEIFVCVEARPIAFENGVTVEPVKHIHHGVDCFGYIFRKQGLPDWGLISDTRPLDVFTERYRTCKFLSINATFPDKKPKLDHMAVADAGELLRQVHPKLATLTHLGMMILQDPYPERFAQKIATKKTRVLTAADGMVIDLDTLHVMAPTETAQRSAQYEIVM